MHTFDVAGVMEQDADDAKRKGFFEKYTQV